jgi:DNA-binding beta-propeller fold protein YncE
MPPFNPLLRAGLTTGLFSLAALASSSPLFAQGAQGAAPGYNKTHPPGDYRIPLSWVDTKAALSAVALHRGLVIAPLGEDHGGGKGRGALAAYEIADPAQPRPVFDSRDHPDRYHKPGQRDYVGDFSEYHHAIFSGDLAIFAERRPTGAGFAIVDFAPLYDNDPATLPAVVSRFTFPGVPNSTNYDGFSFALDWQGGRYVYAPTGSHGLFVIDTKDLANPVLIAHLANQQLYNQVLRSAVALGDTLILSRVAVNSVGVAVVLLDITNPAQPSLLNQFNSNLGYQGFVSGSKFYNTASGADREGFSEIWSYDFADPLKIKSTRLARTHDIKKPEYGYIKDDHLVIGHYPGMSKWKVAGDTAALVAKVEPQFPPADDYAFVSPVGNLVAVTSDHNVKSRLNFGVYDPNPDQRAPELLYVSPKLGQTGVARTAKVGLSFSEFMDPVSLTEKNLILRKLGANKPVPATTSHLAGIVSLVPREPLAPNSTYEVLASANGPTDQVGNPYAGPKLLTRFSTGEVITLHNVEVRAGPPSLVNSEVSLGLSILPAGIAAELEHAWDFGDGTPLTAFSQTPAAKHRFKQVGNYNLTVHTRRRGAQDITRVSSTQVIHGPLNTQAPPRSSTIVHDAAANRLYAVNADHGSLTALDATTLTPVYETPVGRRPGTLALAPGGRLWVTCTDDDSVVVLEAASGRVEHTLRLPAGSAPHGLVVAAAFDRAYVGLEAANSLAEIDIRERALLRVVPIGDSPRELAYDPVRDQLLVPRFIARGMADATLAVLARSTLSPIAQPSFRPTTGPDTGTDGRGSPNYLGAPAISPDGTVAWLPGKKDNLQRGLARDGLPLVFDHTVRSASVCLDLVNNTENFAARLDFDNSDFATAAAFSRFGNFVFFATLGSNTIWVADAYGQFPAFSFDCGGLAPGGLAVAANGATLYVHNTLSRSVTAFDIRGVTLGEGVIGIPRTAKLTQQEVLNPAVLAGKILFHSSDDPRLSQEGYMSCASCHLDGGHDGRVWDLSNLGEGLRNTIDLRGAAGTGRGPLHWSGNFDEIHDFEGQIRALNQGSGLLKNETFKAYGGKIEAPLGDSKAGIANDPALAACRT